MRGKTGIRAVALLGVLGACSPSELRPGSGKGGTAGTAIGAAGTGGGDAAAAAGTGGTGGSAGTGGSTGGTDGCTNVPPSDHLFGCEPTYAEMVAMLCAQGSVPSPERAVALCGSLRIVSLNVPDYARSCVYDDTGALFAARACIEVGTFCGQRCMESVNWAVFECDAWPMVCAADAGSD